MKININYWESIDWNKEGSTSPVFLGVAASAFIMLSIIGYISWEYMSVNKLKNDIDTMKAELADAEVEAQPVTVKNEYIKFLHTTIFSDFDHRESKRKIWSRALEKLALVVPSTITLNSVQITGTNENFNKVDKAKAAEEGKQLIPRTIYVMSLSGFAQGDVINAEKIIEKFSLDLLSESGFSTALETSELQGYGRNKSRNTITGLPFTITATFKPTE